MGFNRRDFIKASAAATSGLAFPSILKAAAPWAALPASVGDISKYKILEIFLPGGASQWENFWVSHDGPQSPHGGNLNWRGLEQSVYELQWQNCNNAPSHSLETKYFGKDDSCTNVSWGPATKPIWRPDIFSRSRMVVTKHGDELHFGGGYRTLTGRRFGNPRGAALGAAIQRHHLSLVQQDIPYSYVFISDKLGKKYFRTYPTLIGQHPGPARPLAIEVGNGASGLFQRASISPKADSVFNELREQYRNLLRWQYTGAQVRSADFEGYDSASDYLMKAQQLDVHFGGTALDTENESACVISPSQADFGLVKTSTKRSLELAAYMLNNGARHTTVIDSGLEIGSLRDSSTPYDGHGNGGSNVVEMTSAHLFNLLQGLANVISNTAPDSYSITPAKPKINLDDTLIIIHTEFNRNPKPSNSGIAREHYPFANVALLIGGPVTSRGIQGGISLEGPAAYETAIATGACSPTDVHAAALLAAGVNPIDADNFTAADDFSETVNPGGGGSPDQIRSNLANKVLGGNGNFTTPSCLTF